MQIINKGYLVSELSVVSVLVKVVIFDGFPDDCPVVLFVIATVPALRSTWFLCHKSRWRGLPSGLLLLISAVVKYSANSLNAGVSAELAHHYLRPQKNRNWV